MTKGKKNVILNCKVKREDKMKYKTIDTKTLKGLRQAERLKRNGWAIVSVGFWGIILCKGIKK